MNGAAYWAARPKVACAMKINGAYPETTIPEYRTLEVSGRHDIEAEIDSYATAQAGSIYVRKRKRPRTLSVRWAIKAASTTALHTALDKLNGLLRVEQPKLIFDDEPGVYYQGTRTHLKIDTLLLDFAAGNISIFCSDPYKYSITEKTVTADSNGVITVNYAGTAPANPVFTVTAASEATGYKFTTSEGTSISVGKIFTPEGDDVTAPDTIENVDFSQFDQFDPLPSGWAAATVQYDQVYTLSGTAGFDSHYGLTATSFGSGNGWHGPAVLYTPTDSNNLHTMKNFKMSWSLNLIGSAFAAKGRFTALFYYYDADAGTNKTAIAITISKNKNSNSGMTYVRAFNEIIKQAEWGLGQAFQQASYSVIKVKEYVALITPYGMYTYRVDGLADVEIVGAELAFVAYGGETPVNTLLQSARCSKYDDNLDFEDFVNVFLAGDVIKADCGSAKIYFNDDESPMLGDVSNQWEEMALEPGLNSIQCGTNSWVSDAPTYKLKYREVFL